MKLDFLQTNEFIKQALIKGDPANILRIDNTARYFIECLLGDKEPSHEIYSERTLVEAGVFPTNKEYLLHRIMPMTIDIIRESDIAGFVDVHNDMHTDPNREYMYEQFPGVPIYSGHSILVMDPGGLLGISRVGPCPDPWTKYLKGKKVLVISTHAETIKQQWQKIDKIWGSNKDVITPFELAGIIRSPYHPMMDDRQLPNCENWEDNVEYIKREMEKYDFDVLLSGSTTSSPFYTAHAKAMGKIGIQTGGAIQIFFGILGYRWTKVDGYKAWHDLYNEHWTYPLPIDSAQKREQYKFLETNFAYW
jgi:hypothetical protein